MNMTTETGEPAPFKPPSLFGRLAVVVGVIAAVAYFNRPLPPPPPKPPPKPKPAKEITASTWLNTNGKPIKLKDLKGRLVLLEFWRSECHLCEEVWPGLKTLAQQYSKDLTVITVHTPVEQRERDLDLLRALVKEKGITLPVAVDNQRATLRAYGLEQLTPTFVLINRKHNVISVQPTKDALEVLDRQIQQLLAGDDLEPAKAN